MMAGPRQREDIKAYCMALGLSGIADNFESLRKDSSDYYDYLLCLLRCEFREMEKRDTENRARCAVHTEDGSG